MIKIAFLVSGSGTNMQAVLDKIDAGEIKAKPTAVICSNANAFALERAKAHNIATFVCALKDFSSPQKRDEAAIKILKECGADYIILAGYLGILTPVFIEAFRNRIINIHPSLLPKYGGSGYFGINVHRAVLAAREPFTGATVHFVNEGTDTGEIIMQKSIQILPSDTPEILQKKVLENCEYPLLTEVVKLLANGQIRLQNGKVKIDPKGEK